MLIEIIQTLYTDLSHIRLKFCTKSNRIILILINLKLFLVKLL